MAGQAKPPQGVLTAPRDASNIAQLLRGPLAQLVEHLPFKERVAGSNPARLTSPHFSPGGAMIAPSTVCAGKISKYRWQFTEDKLCFIVYQRPGEKCGLDPLIGRTRQPPDPHAGHLPNPPPSPVRLAWPRTPPFHGGNRGSNPLRDANIFNKDMIGVSSLSIPPSAWPSATRRNSRDPAGRSLCARSKRMLPRKAK